MPLTYISLARLLKSQTLVQHEATEQLLYPKLDGIACKKDYADLLKTFYGFYAPLEKIISTQIFPRHLIDIGERRNAYHIIDDLIALGENVYELPVCNSLPLIQGKAEAFGALYVMEGSTLGGRMIYKMLLRKHAGFLQPGQLHFFNGYGDATATKWKVFQDSLEKVEDKNSAVNAANETFTLFQNWIKQNLYGEPHSA